MTTVYALDLRLNKRVLVDGVVHFAAHESFTVADETPRPWRTRCGIHTGNAVPGLPSDDSILEYLGDDDEHVVVTCVACLGERRRER